MRPLAPALIAVVLAIGGCTSPAARSDSPRPSETASNSAGATPLDAVSGLKARPLRLSRAGAGCPASAVRPLDLTWDGPTGGIGGFATRQGPLVLLLSEESVPVPRVRFHGTLYVHRAVVPLGPSSAPGWGALKTVWLSQPAYQGPVLVRGRQLDGSGAVRVGGVPTTKQFVLPAGPEVNGGDGYRPGIAYVWLRRAGCYGFQVDGIGFSHHVVVLVIPSRGTA
jgi:hypothetical protein